MTVDEEEPRRGAALGLLAAAPLFAAYEWSLRAGGTGERNAAEALLFLPLEAAPVVVRPWVLVSLCLVAAAVLVRREVALIPAAAREVAEGALAAVVLGPVLLGVAALLGDAAPSWPHLEARPAELAPPEVVAFHAGGGAFEELLFRFGLYGLLFLLTRRALAAGGVTDGAARTAGELVGLLGSALAFAAFHLERVLAPLGAGGEPFDGGLFLWRTLAGLALGALFRWRGPGAAVWAHALFNAALVLGAGPGALL